MNEKISFYAPPFPTIQSHHEKIDAAKKYGLSAVEALNDYEFIIPDKEYALKLKNYADERNVVCPCFSVFANFAGSDYQEVIDKVKKYAEIAKILGSPYLHHTIVSDYTNPDSIIPYKKEYFDKGVNAVREIYDYAESLGVKTIYEDQGYVFNGVEGFGNFIAEVNRDVGVVADFGNIYQSGDGITEFVEAFIDKICHVHIKDVFISDENNDGKGLKTINGKYMYETKLGKGNVDFKGAIKLLKQIGYSGYYSIERGISEDNPILMKEMLDFVKSIIKG